MSALIATCDGQFVKAFPLTPGKRNYGFHPSFGLISEEAATERMNSAKRKGAIKSDKNWLYRFNMDVNCGRPRISALDGCKIESINGGWMIQAAGKSWKLSTNLDGINFPTAQAFKEDDTLTKKISFAALIFFLLLGAGLMLWSPVEEEKVETSEDPVTVIIKKQKTVTVTSASKVLKNVTPQTKKVVQQELGFLGLVGKKDLSKAVGGAQLKLNASPGAGKGGNAGSGGEVLAGLGRGVRATTVGNTGVKGLGGVGTKDIGGGAGGYGDVVIASGQGRGISAIAVSQGVGVDGGLDRHVIQATIAKYLSQVRACYEERLRVNPGLEGTLSMDFEIGASGRLNYSRVKSSSVGDPAVGDCVATKMMSWQFPKPRGGVNVKVNYPFALRPVGR